MASQGMFRCAFCNRSDFRSQRGLTQHLNKKESCGIAFARSQRLNLGQCNETQSNQTPTVEANVCEAPEIEGRDVPQSITMRCHDLDSAVAELGAHYQSDYDDLTAAHDDDDDDNALLPPEDCDEDGLSESRGGDAESGQSFTDPSDSGQMSDGTRGPDTWIRDQFREYASYMKDNHSPFTEDEKTAIELMHTLRQKGAPMDAYNQLLMWHLKAAGKAHHYETGRANAHFISKNVLLDRLTKRYNMREKFPYTKTIKLPVSKSTVKISLHDTKAVIQRLLTEPRNNPEDYAFFGGDPRAPPPKDLDYVADLNTGQAYAETHAKLCTEPGAQLLAIPIYIDGAAVSQFHDMEIVSVKIALGILKREARTKEYNWASLGYVEKVPVNDGKGRALVKEANHLEEQDAISSDDDSDLPDEMAGVGEDPVQDWHAMVSCILEGLVDLIQTGFMWDQAHNGQVTENIQYELFVPFIKCDNKEADTMCGRYQNRSTTNQICRVCHILTRHCDRHMANETPKTKSEIQRLVQKGDLARLKGLSQNYLLNAFHDVRFSMANDRSVHGACPTDMLHTVQLGIFKYALQTFFLYLGKTSDKSKRIDALAKVYCKEFGRTSDRSLPNTNFSKGIRGGGKMMAKEYRGVLLVMLALFRSTKGREIMEHRSAYFKAESTKDDWILLIEILLEWEAYLNSERMYTRHVKRLAQKHRYILYLFRKIAQRTEGMGLKLIKFHIILHLADDILQFGVPLEFDTGANEGHHKDAKKAAKLTQKEAASFQYQTALRMIEYHLLELAMEEIWHDTKLWEYFCPYEGETVTNSGQNDEEASDMDVSEPEVEGEIVVQTGETGIRVWIDEDTGNPTFSLLTRSKYAAKTRWNIPLVKFLIALQDKMDCLPSNYLEIRTWHKRGDQIFRGHPNYRGKGPWKDWAWVDWGPGYGRLAAHIWCFVVLKNMPTGRQSISHGGIARLKDGVYAVVESSALDDTAGEVQRSDLLMPIHKEIEMDEVGLVTKRTFYLADTEAIVGPCCVVPDIGGASNRYFVVRPREEWASEFIRWVEDPHNLDEMDAFSTDEDTSSSEEEDENSGEDSGMGLKQSKNGVLESSSEEEESD